MPESIEATRSVSPSFDLQASISKQFAELQRSLEEDEAYTSDSFGSEKLLKECALRLENKILSECSDVDSFLEIHDLGSVSGEDQMNMIVQRECNAFEVLELHSQIEKNKRVLKSLQQDEIFKM